MGDLSKLKVAIGQVELVPRAPSPTTRRVPSAWSIARSMPAPTCSSCPDRSMTPAGRPSDRAQRFAHRRCGQCGAVEAWASVSHRPGQSPGDMHAISSVDRRAPGRFGIQADRMASRPAVVRSPVGMRNVGKNVLAYDGGHACSPTPMGACLRCATISRKTSRFPFAEHRPSWRTLRETSCLTAL